MQICVIITTLKGVFCHVSPALGTVTKFLKDSISTPGEIITTQKVVSKVYRYPLAFSKDVLGLTQRIYNLGSTSKL